MSVRAARLRVRRAAGWLAAAALCQLVALVAAGRQPDPAAGRPQVYVADVDALIHPVSAEFIGQTIEQADAAEADLVVLMLQTPGGLVDATRTINTSIIEAETPVVVFVGPSGTRAASAGFLITIAADVAAMAPGTHIGAAHPVAGTGQPMDETMAEKAASDVAAYARSLASQRRRNVELAEEAVTESRSFTEQEALEATPPLIDLVASDLETLIEQLDGREVLRWSGDTVVLRTADAEIERVGMNWRQRLLSAVAHPQVAVILLSLGTLGLTIELWNPGGIVPGVAGVLCLLLAFFAFQILPINYVGLTLIVFGLALLVAEMLTATYGLLAAGGVAGMVLGALMLVDSPAPEMQLGWPFIVSSMLALGLIVSLLVRLGVRSQLRGPVTGPSGMIAQLGRTTGPIAAGGAGTVSTHGELWSATAAEAIGADEQVRVVAVDGMRLTVRREPPRTPGGARQ